VGLGERKWLREEAPRRVELIGGVLERKETKRGRKMFEDADRRLRTRGRHRLFTVSRKVFGIAHQRIAIFNNIYYS
jgi:hypothetical protein